MKPSCNLGHLFAHDQNEYYFMALLVSPLNEDLQHQEYQLFLQIAGLIIWKHVHSRIFPTSSLSFFSPGED